MAQEWLVENFHDHVTRQQTCGYLSFFDFNTWNYIWGVVKKRGLKAPQKHKRLVVIIIAIVNENYFTWTCSRFWSHVEAILEIIGSIIEYFF